MGAIINRVGGRRGVRKPEREGEGGGRRACHYRYFSRPSITVARQCRGMLRWAWLKPRVPSRPAPKEMRGEKEVKPLLHQSSYCFIHVLSGSLAFAPCFVSITWILQWVPVDGAHVSTYISLLPLSVKWLCRERCLPTTLFFFFLNSFWDVKSRNNNSAALFFFAALQNAI